MQMYLSDTTPSLQNTTYLLNITPDQKSPPSPQHMPSGCFVASHILQTSAALLATFSRTLIPDKTDSFLKVSLKLIPCIFPLRPGKKNNPDQSWVSAG